MRCLEMSKSTIDVGKRKLLVLNPGINYRHYSENGDVYRFSFTILMEARNIFLSKFHTPMLGFALLFSTCETGGLLVPNKCLFERKREHRFLSKKWKCINFMAQCSSKETMKWIHLLPHTKMWHYILHELHQS